MDTLELQRLNMVESQVRPSDITDRRLIRAMMEIPRELYAAEGARAVAYADTDLPIAMAQTGTPSRWSLAPRVQAKLIQALDIGEADMVLEIGSGTGYGAAVLSRLARKVVALESDRVLCDRARDTLATCGMDNVDVVHGDLAAGYDGQSPYDAIMISGLVEQVPTALLDQLKDGGRLITVLSHKTVGFGRATRWLRSGDTFASWPLFEAGAKPLPGFRVEPAFVF